MRLRLEMLAGVALALCPVVASAQSQPKAVIELFTSQGCSSCPPADALLKKFTAERPDLMPLTLPVDYWDHLGWKDTLASPKHTSRQKAYARTLSSGNVYTPQAVVNGVAQAIGSNEAEIMAAVETSAKTLAGSRVEVSARTQDGRIIVDVGAAAAAAKDRSATVWLAIVEPKAYVDIKHGENRGRKLGYYNVVRDLTPAGMWSGKAMTLELPAGALLQPGAKCAVIVQAGEMGRILGATWVAQR